MKKRTIYLNGNIFSQSITGVQRFGIELIRQLDALAPDYNIHFILLIKENKYPSFTDSLQHIRVKKVGWFSSKLWEQFDLFVHAGGKPLVTFASAAPVFKRNQYFAIHDASIYDQPHVLSCIYRLWYRCVYAVITKRVRKIITVSQFSSQRLQKALHVDAAKMAIVHDGGDHLSSIAEDNSILEQLPLHKKIVFVVGSLNPYKNFTQVLAVANVLQDEPNIHFAIAGNINNKIFRNSSGIKELLVSDNITFLGSITDEQLQAMYRSARCFLFLSLYEGFGIPVAEAMNAGCPVVCSDAACLPELFSRYTYMVNPNETAIIAAAVKKVCSDDEVYSRYQQKAAEGSQVYRWRESAKTLLQVLNEQEG